MNKHIVCVNEHTYKRKFLVLSTVGTKRKPTTSTLVETWDFLTVKSIYLTHSTWTIPWVLLQITYDGTNPLVFAKSRKTQLLTEKTCFSQNIFCWTVFLSVMVYTEVPDRVSMLVICHCPLQINPFPSLCKGSNISATTERITRTDFLELFRIFSNWGFCFPLRGLLFGFWVVTVKSCFISCYDSWGEVLDISYFFWYLVAHRCCCFCLLVSSHGANWVFMSSLGICWLHP
jgi:hypothetical protein